MVLKSVPNEKESLENENKMEIKIIFVPMDTIFIQFNFSFQAFFLCFIPTYI